MNVSSEGLLVILFVGLVAGWLGGQIVQGTGFGIIGDLVVGILGAFIGSTLIMATAPAPSIPRGLREWTTFQPRLLANVGLSERN
jgi:hypothetical protein